MNKTQRRKRDNAHRKEHEYEEAPSGYIWLVNAKEPLMKFEKGYGYLGTLAFDGDDEKVQCHFCGKWFGALGNHLAREHSMTVREYKELTGLHNTTALISEKMREKLIRKGLGKRMKNLRPGKPMSQETKDKIRDSLKQNRLQNKNRNGTCPEQLISRLQEVANKVGRTPTTRELPFYDALLRTYGTYEEACRFAGLEPRKSGQNVSYGKRTKHTKKGFVDFTRAFVLEHNKLPNYTEFCNNGKRALWEKSTNLKWDKKAMFKEATYIDGKYRKLPKQDMTNFRFSDAELLRFLREFQKHHGRAPTYSDAKRGLLPHLSRYSYRFGSWKKAIAEAGL